MNTRNISIVILIAILSMPLFADSPFSLSASAGMNFPIMNQNLYNIGGGGAIAGTFRLGSIPYIRALGHIDFSFASTTVNKNITMLSFGGGVDGVFPLLPILDLRTVLSGGYGLFLYEGDLCGSPFIKGEVQLHFNFTSSFSLGVSGGYKHYFPDSYSEITAGISTVISLGGNKGSQMNIENIDFDPVFPVLYKYYDDNSLGPISLNNQEKGAINNVKASLYIENYMDNPKECVLIQKMEKGEVRHIPLFALFNDSVLDITEGTKVQTEIIVEYEYLNDDLSTSSSKSVSLYDRNAMT